MHKTAYIIITAFMLTLAACGHEMDIPESINIPAAKAPVAKPAGQKKEEVRYVYRGDQRPDPFVPLNIAGVAVTTDEMVTPNIASLALKGIFSSGKQRVALISGGTITYLLKDSRLYDNRQRMIKGISGAIKNDSVIIIAPDKTMRELKLHEKE